MREKKWCIVGILLRFTKEAKEMIKKIRDTVLGNAGPRKLAYN